MPDLVEWLEENGIEQVETIVSDMAGRARGKLVPAAQVGKGVVKLPVALFGQTTAGDFYLPQDNVEDRDMLCRPVADTARVQPWAAEPTASVLMDCACADGSPVGAAPRAVLQRVVGLYEEQGWRPVVAPEVEFYLVGGSVGEAPVDPYGTDQVHDHSALFEQLNDYCQRQGIALGAMSQELGPGQFEVNFEHGDPLRLADDVFHFKRTLRRTASAFDRQATFLAKLSPEHPGSSLHIHQSIVDAAGNNVFSNSDGSASERFGHYIGGLQAFMHQAFLLFAPYANSYRRFMSSWSSPVNLEWGADNRTTGYRVPDSPPEARRVENRLAGSDVNPYLAIAGTLACGYLGMLRKTEPRPAIEGSAHDIPYALHRHFYEALDSFRESAAMRDSLGDDFVTAYAAMKEQEYRDYQQRIPEWELAELMQTV